MLFKIKKKELQNSTVFIHYIISYKITVVVWNTSEKCATTWTIEIERKKHVFA